MEKMPHLKDFPIVMAALEAERNLIWHTQARLFSRVNEPACLLKDEAYEVDLSEPRFICTYQGKFSSGGPAQLIGTYHPQDQTWLWGFHNTSVSENAWREVRFALEENADLAPLIATPKFLLSEDQSRQLATWLARKARFLGAYPAQVGQSIAYLGLDLSTDPNAIPEPEDNPWCTLCGSAREHVKILLKGENGFMCDECIEKHLVVAEAEPASESSKPDASMPSCLLCDGSDTPRIFHRYTSVCYDCINTAGGILKQQNE